MITTLEKISEGTTLLELEIKVENWKKKYSEAYYDFKTKAIIVVT